MAASNHQPRQGDFTITGSWTWAGLFGWLSYWLWSSAKHGSDGAAIAALVMGCFALAKFIHGLRAWDRHRDRRKLEKFAREPSTNQGQARWAQLAELKQAGMLKAKGIFLGAMLGRDIFYNGEASMLSFAPPGAGKGICLAVPNLLTNPISMVVTDPKGELYAMTHRYRRDKLGHRIIVLCPWADKMSEELGIEIEDHGYNPMSILHPGPDVKDEAELLASLILPGKPNMSANDEFWLDGGQTLNSAFMLELISEYENPTLPMLRDRLLAAPDEILETLVNMTESDDFGGCLRQYGGKLLGAHKNAPEQFEGWMGNAQKGLKIYDSFGPLAGHVSGPGFDFRTLKTIPTTVYLIMPTDRAVTHAAWLNLVISLAMETVGRDRSNKRVLFLLDEFANLGYLPNVLRAIALYRGQGVQAWCIVQQLTQLERLYKREGLREFMGMAEVVNAFGVWEPENIKMLSQWLGNETRRGFSQNISPVQHDGKFTYNYNASDVGAPLMRPEEIRTMPTDQQLIFYRNLPPIRAQKVSYLERRKLRRRADPNPYHRKK